MPSYDKINKVTILPRISGVGGFTQFLPSEERLANSMYTREYLESKLCVLMGGRAAEEIVYGSSQITTGATSDLNEARKIADQMVKTWGFGHTLASWDGSESENTKTESERNMSVLVKTAYERAKKIVNDHREQLESLKAMLIEKETINAIDVKTIFTESD